MEFEQIFCRDGRNQHDRIMRYSALETFMTKRAFSETLYVDPSTDFWPVRPRKGFQEFLGTLRDKNEIEFESTGHTEFFPTIFLQKGKD